MLRPKIYKDRYRHLSDWYELIKRMSELEYSSMWMEITDRELMFLYECCVPERSTCAYLVFTFLAGEPIVENRQGTVHYAVVLVNGRCFRRPAVAELYKPARYIAEVTRQFFPAQFPGRES